MEGLWIHRQGGRRPREVGRQRPARRIPFVLLAFYWSLARVAATELGQDRGEAHTINFSLSSNPHRNGVSAPTSIA